MTAAQSRRLEQAILAVMVLWSGGYVHSGVMYVIHSPPSWTHDLDAGLIHSGVLSAPGILDTLKWFVGPWAGVVPFYRPLSSYLFWAEWRLFGSGECWYFLATAFGHAAVVVLFSQLYRKVSEHYGHTPTLLGVFVTTGVFVGLLDTSRRFAIGDTLVVWKNQPDIFAAVFCFASVLYYMSAIQGKRGSLAWSVVCYLAACGFKEIAIPLPMVFLAIEGSQAWRGGGGRRLAPLFVAAAAFLVVRTASLHGIGFRDGSNHAWIARSASELLGPFSSLVLKQWLAPALAVTVFGISLLPLPTRYSRFSRLVIRVVLFLAAASVIGALSLRETDNRANIWFGIFVLTEPVTLVPAVSQVVTLMLGLAVFRSSPRQFFLPMAWGVLFLAPLAAAPGLPHRLYIPGAGYALLMGWGAELAFESQRTTWRARGINAEGSAS